ncbi:hypothetical protein [Sporolactobacillus vineae]|uniref:hypothetical protein n=1 Tax=Sporolactobacillus vineae TaxID=444463 RepID=UPI000287EFDD|nr:hypothetical protein [Sporolactobacillus vineae]
MLKRWTIEIAVIFCLLLVSVVYGTVIVRDAQSPQTQVNLPAQKLIIPPQAQTATADAPVAQSSRPEASPQAAPGISRAGNSFSSVISHFFLTCIRSIAGLVDSVIQLLF